MSKGFNPQPKIQIANPLPSGFTGRNEIVDIWFSENIPVEEIKHKSQLHLPEGITINKTELIPENQASLGGSIEKSEYIITISQHSSELIERKIENIIKSSSIKRMRNGKEYDLRPLIKKIEIISRSKDSTQLLMCLSAGPNQTGRPDEVIFQMGLQLSDCEIDRLRFS